MQFTNYFFASIICFLGLLAGLALVKIAPEEQKPLQRYFSFFKRAIFFLLFAFLIFYYFNNIFYVLTLTTYFIFLLFVDFKTKDLLKNSMVNYTAFGVLFFLSSSNKNLFAIDSSLIFLYGLPIASIIYDKKKKNHHQMFFYNMGFLAIANLLFFI